VTEPPVSISTADAGRAGPQQEASPQRSEPAQPPPGPGATSSFRTIGWDGPLPPWRGPMEVLIAQEGRDLVVPSHLTDEFDFDAQSCRHVTLLFFKTRASLEVHVALRLTLLQFGRRQYRIPAWDVHELLRLSSNRDSSGRLHIRVTARCASYITPHIPMIPTSQHRFVCSLPVVMHSLSQSELCWIQHVSG